MAALQGHVQVAKSPVIIAAPDEDIDRSSRPLKRQFCP